MSLLFQGRSYWLQVALLFSFLTSSTEALAISIFEARKRLPLRNGEKTQKDFYLNGGLESGLKAGMVLRVTRQVTLYDTYQNKSPGDLVIPVGELKIIFVQKGLSVARLHRIFDRQNLPVLEDNFLMVGDEVDVSSARMDRAPKSQKKSVKMGPPAPQSVKRKGSASRSVVKRKGSASQSVVRKKGSASFSSKAPRPISRVSQEGKKPAGASLYLE